MTETYVWRISSPSAIRTLRKSTHIDSQIFELCGFKWYLRFYGASSVYGGNVYFYLAERPSIVRNILLSRYTLSMDEGGIERTRTKVTFSDQGNYHGGEIMKSSEMEQLQTSTYTVKVTATLLRVDDENGEDITDIYIHQIEEKKKPKKQFEEKQVDIAQSSYIVETVNMHAIRLDSMALKMQEMMKNITRIQETLRDITLQINEEKKEDKNALRKEIDEINKKMNVLLSNNDKNYEGNKEKMILKEWMVKKLKLPEYYDIFIENGIESLNVAKMLTMNELNMMGITKIGHKMKILHAVIDLKQDNEGGSAYI